MEIKDIIEQQKLEKALERSKKKQDDFTRKEFLNDCYKFWKEYKKVEHHYTWWLGWFSLDYILFGRWENFRKVRFTLPEDYVENSWSSVRSALPLTFCGFVSGCEAWAMSGRAACTKPLL